MHCTTEKFRGQSWLIHAFIAAGEGGAGVSEGAVDGARAFTEHGVHYRAKNCSEVTGTAAAAGEGGVSEGAAGEHQPEAAHGHCF